VSRPRAGATDDIHGAQATLSAERRLADAVEELGRLPVLSATVRRVQTIAESEEAGIGDRVAALEGDQGLATDLLRYANSAACARPLRGAQHPRRRHARRPQGDRAARRRGRDLPLLPTRAGQRRPLDRPPAPARRRGRGVSQSIAERTGASADIAHLGGLLHDVLIGAASSALEAESLLVVLSHRRGAVRGQALRARPRRAVLRPRTSTAAW
jgi:hypothetical protein